MKYPSIRTHIRLDTSYYQNVHRYRLYTQPPSHRQLFVTNIRVTTV